MLKERSPDDSKELIFKDRWHGDRIEHVSKTFQRTVDRLGLNKGVEDPRQYVMFHPLGHTFGSSLAIQETPILTIKELMGPKTLVMTERGIS